MDFFAVVHSRRSTRAFTPQPVETEKLQALLEAIDRAPSAGNLQGYEVYVVSGPELRAQLAQAALGQDFIAQAPLALVFCANPGRSIKRYGQRGASLYCLQDATIACAYAMLAATALGLACVWVGAFNEEQVRDSLALGKDLRPVAILPVGYAGERPEPTPRRSLESLVHYVP